jgi:hypothetical protein
MTKADLETLGDFDWAKGIAQISGVQFLDETVFMSEKNYWALLYRYGHAGARYSPRIKGQKRRGRK